jgi:hypothetical protein
MGLFRGVLLGTGAALVSVAAAQAADLPSRKAAPVEYVRVCDAYGAGFFFIPGTQTCLRIGGRVRADYAFVPATNIITAATGSGGTVSGAAAVSSFKDAQHTVGWEARGRINVDARTQTSFGTVQAAFQMRMARTKGVLSSNDGAQANGHGSASTLESAFIRFAGFTFGASRDNFAFMPSLTYGAGHWASFANGAKQLAYTHTFGGGVSATIALQDHQDTTLGSANANGTWTATTGTFTPGSAPYYVHNSLPQVNGRLDWQQSWGELSVAAAVANVSANDTANGYNQNETVWAVGGGLKLNLPMLASGSALWLHAAYADGMTEYTTNWTSVKTTAYNRDVGGNTMNHPSYVYEVGGIETVKSWNVAALLQHFWTPQWRSVAFASYGQIDAPASAAARNWNGTNGFGDATVWNIGTNLAWLPTRDFEIGVEVIYARVSQDVRSGVVYGAGSTISTAGTVSRASESNLTGRLRVERNF